MTRPTVFFLHALGGSARAVDRVAALLPPDWDVLAPDLPGFADTSTAPGLTVSETVAFVERFVGDHPSSRWLLAGHSMGAKIASVVAARTLAGRNRLFGLAGVALLAGSPPSPEPMDEQRRRQMIGWAGDGSIPEAPAREFVDANVGSALPPELDAAAVADVRRTSGEAWTAWLTRGSREDWSGEVDTLDLPAVILAGGSDGDLGPDAQRRHNAPHYPRARVQVLDGAGHLLPLERPADVAEHLQALWSEAARGPEVPADTAALIRSGHVSARVRATLARRALADPSDYTPRAVSAAQLDVLRVVADRVVPQGGARIDLAVRLDAQLAAGDGDGWRFDGMPADVEAHRAALDALADLPGADPDEQDRLLTAVADGDGPSGGLDPAQLARWFEDCRTDLVRLWLAHPATMARIGFDGFANGGDGSRFQGFQLLAAGTREGWEPAGVVQR